MANTKVTGDLIASSTIATGNIADNAVTSDKISGITTAHITEGSNLYYTDARADARVALVVDSAPSTLNTLNELADALGDDPNFATTTATSIGLKAPLASPSFTGNATFASRVSAGESFNSVKDGADTVADGPFFALKNAAGTRQYINQLDASNNIDYWYYNGSAWTQTISLLTNGGATFAGIITASSSSSGDYVRLYGSSGTGKWDIYGNGANLRISDNESAGILVVDTGATFAGTVNVQGDDKGVVVKSANGTINATMGAASSSAVTTGAITVRHGGTSKIVLNANDNSYFNNGNVGIGTTSPNGVKFQTVQTTSGEWTGGFKNYTDGAYGLRVDMSNSSSVQAALQVYTGAGTGFVVKNTGNVGIGTFTPNKKLTVYGGNDNGIWVDSSGTRYTSVAWGNNGSEKANIAYDNTNSNFALTAYGASNTIFTNNSSERMRITSGGAILIGQTSNLTSTGTLQVNGMIDQTDVLKAIRMYNGTTFVGGIGSGQWAFGSRPTDYSLYAQNNLLFHAGSGNSIDMIINGSHNVGIGTVSPSSKLTVVDGNNTFVSQDGNGYARFTHENGSVQLGLFRTGQNAGGGYIGADGNTCFHIRDASFATKLYLTQVGSLGIGTTSPTRKLDVAGEITHEGLVPKAGAFVDGLVTINKTVSTTANTWTSLDISLSNIGGSGTFAVQVYSDAHGSTNGSWYSMYWSGMMSWYHTNVNATDTDEIPLHAAGHAMNGSTLELRTKLHTADGTSYANRCELQIKTSSALSSAPISFRFRKLL